MNIFWLMRLVRRMFLMNIVDGEGGGGVAAPAAPEPAAAPAPVEAPATPAAAAPAEPARPTSMLEAIEQGLGQPRDQQGRFAPKDPNAPAPTAAAPAAPAAPGAPAAPAAAPAAPAAAAPTPPAADEDPLAMPEGLSPKGQERFQKLANTVREQTQQLEQRERQLSYVQETFQEHGIRQEQFEQAAGVIGMMNRGDYAGAQKILQQQLQQIALMTGTQPNIDALADFPDLRQAVDGMQITEAMALEVARGRAQQYRQTQQAEQQQVQQRQTQQSQQAIQTATASVDAFCKRMAASDLDYAAIEAQLLPELPNLLRGLPPVAWQNTVETQYRLLKNAASKFKAAAPAAPAPPILRATGQGSPQQAPKSMHEAMWGTAAPTA